MTRKNHYNILSKIKFMLIGAVLTYLIVFSAPHVTATNENTYSPTIDGKEVRINYLLTGLTLKNNDAAITPTYEELLEFIKENKVDEIPYVKGVFMCGQYAQMLHNSAEKAGIRSGVVVIRSDESKFNHCLNMFDTSDKGIVYIDCHPHDQFVEFDHCFYKVTSISDESITNTIDLIDAKFYYFW